MKVFVVFEGGEVMGVVDTLAGAMLIAKDARLDDDEPWSHWNELGVGAWERFLFAPTSPSRHQQIELHHVKTERAVRSQWWHQKYPRRGGRS